MLLQVADVLVSPRSFGDNFPLKIFDYLEARRPIVATDIATHRSVLDEGCSLLTPPNAAAMAAGIAGLLDDPHRANSLASAAAARSAERYGWRSFVGLVAGIYGDALAAAPAIAGAGHDQAAPAHTLVAAGGDQ